jgi:hypothetical protein
MESSNESIASLQYQNLEWKVQTLSASLCDTFGIFFDFCCVVGDWNERYVDFRLQRALVGRNPSYNEHEKRVFRRNADEWWAVGLPRKLANGWPKKGYSALREEARECLEI